MLLKKRKETNRTKEITLIAMLAAIIAVSGTFKIPSPFVGTEFQLSAPIAVVIAALFGFKRYLSAGIIASGINMLIGTHTIVNVLVAMIFRIVAGGIISIFGTTLIILIVAGPIGTLVARFVLAAVLDVNPAILIVAALPGMIFTAIITAIVFPIAKKNMKLTIFQDFIINHENKMGSRKYESI
ncbi:hypothetical protein [Bacillus sp. JJ722]|uniref:hypothetical protein n=1 Tax=Bacillus sp. JJ722 TaxID=3122973 RepID=UPI002FFDB72B